MSFHDDFWASLDVDHEAEERQRSYRLVRQATLGPWRQVIAAVDETDFANRTSLVAPTVAKIAAEISEIPEETTAQVLAAFRSDWDGLRSAAAQERQERQERRVAAAAQAPAPSLARSASAVPAGPSPWAQVMDLGMRSIAADAGIVGRGWEHVGEENGFGQKPIGDEDWDADPWPGSEEERYGHVDFGRQAASTISPVKARQIAADWHGGQATPLYSFASSGYLHPDLESDISKTLAEVHRAITDPKHHAHASYRLGDARQLQSLLNHVRSQRPKGWDTWDPADQDAHVRQTYRPAARYQSAQSWEGNVTDDEKAGEDWAQQLKNAEARHPKDAQEVQDREQEIARLRGQIDHLKGVEGHTAARRNAGLVNVDPTNPSRHIKVTYSAITPELAAAGNYPDLGWENRHGIPMEPDEVDADEGKSAVDNAVEHLQDHGAVHPSSSRFSPGTWYTTDPETNYQTGAETTYSHHLYGFDPKEEAEVHARVTGQPHTAARRPSPKGEAPAGGSRVAAERGDGGPQTEDTSAESEEGRSARRHRLSGLWRKITSAPTDVPARPAPYGGASNPFVPQSPSGASQTPPPPPSASAPAQVRTAPPAAAGAEALTPQEDTKTPSNLQPVSARQAKVGELAAEVLADDPSIPVHEAVRLATAVLSAFPSVVTGKAHTGSYGSFNFGSLSQADIDSLGLTDCPQCQREALSKTLNQCLLCNYYDADPVLTRPESHPAPQNPWVDPLA